MSQTSAKDARAYQFLGPSTRISPVISAPGEHPLARSEITIGTIATFAREMPEEVVRAPCVEREVEFGPETRRISPEQAKNSLTR